MPYDIFGYYHSDETKEKISRSMREKGIHKGANNPSARAIVQLNLDHTFVKRWDYIGQAVQELDYVKRASTLSSVCRGFKDPKVKNKTAYGYIWMYEDEYLENKDRLKPLKIREKYTRVVRLDLSGNYLHTHPSMSDALKFVGQPITCGNITKVCKGAYPTVYGYKWMYERDYIKLHEEYQVAV